MIIDPKTLVERGIVRKIKSHRQIQPQSLDLTIESIHQLCGVGALTKKLRRFPKYIKLSPLPRWINNPAKIKGSFFVLHPSKYYSVVFNERVNLPVGVVAFLTTKSTASRLGIQTNTGVWDSGHIGAFVMEITTFSTVVLEKDVSIAQAYFLPSYSNRLYKGKWNHQESHFLNGRR